MEQQTLRELHCALVKVLQRFEACGTVGAKAFCSGLGICANLKGVYPDITDRHWGVISALWMRWPMFPGSVRAPVPCEGSAPGTAYVLIHNKWNTQTQYGYDRLRLLKWLIGETGRLLEGGDNA